MKSAPSVAVIPFVVFVLFVLFLQAAADASTKALPAPTNRFSSVIEKIERIYAVSVERFTRSMRSSVVQFEVLTRVSSVQGRESDSGEGEAEEPAPGSDEYDTEDSFIDDIELVSGLRLPQPWRTHME